MQLSRRDRAEAAVLAIIVVYGVGERLIDLALVGNDRLGFDARGYRYLAFNMTTPYSTDFREPGWPWLIRAWSWVFGPSSEATRALTVTLSVAIIVAVWWLGRQLSGRRGVGLIAAALTAASVPLTAHSVRGLRLEAWCLALLAFTYALFAADIPPRRRSVLLWVTGSAALLINLAAITLIVPMVIYIGWRRRLGWRSTVAVLVGVAVLVAPHTAYEYRTYGDPMWSSNIHAVFYRNLEFVRYGTGCAGCPSPAGLRLDAYGGRRTTWAEYIFGMHAVGTVARRFADGYGRVFLYDGPVMRRGLGPAIAVLWVLGVVLLLTRPEREMLLVPLLALGGTAFVVPVTAFDWRLTYHVAPFVYLVAAVGCVGVVDGVAMLARRRRGRPAG